MLSSERRSKIINSTARDNYHFNSQTPHTLITGQPTDISAIFEFRWYKWCYYRDPDAKLPDPTEHIGRIVILVDHSGIDISQWVIN